MVILLAAGALTAQVLTRQTIDPPLVDMPRKVFEITGGNPRECGRHPMRQVAGNFLEATREQLQASVECARDAIKNGQPFWTFVERRGIDSWVATGLLLTASGEVRRFVYDSAPCGSPGCQPRLELQPCQLPSVTSTGGVPDFGCP